MKKFVSVLMALAMVLSLAACGAKAPVETTAPTEAPVETTVPTEAVPETEAPTEGAASGEVTLEELLNKIVEQNPVEFMGGTMPVDLTDTSEDGLWAVKYYTGLDNAESVTEAAFFEPMMGSIAFSMVMVRVAPEADAKTVAEAMKAGIDTRKWICVEADDLMVASYADMVMLIMVDSNSGMTAQSFVDAFQSVVGAELDFVI